ncbi:magnesium chelatase subunit D [Nocardioides luteus]|uniref:Mg-protoporphyrin IX chelatase n=1 Tax=Nocardioides luteus TaxID=1844 RepID=A0ABQ5T387_9ACTN|nr:VWA domain-containing protein [Nocardioides luteus]MDR7311633.1 magnesium chelatase subunit D [Nocardioides luteus]GGR54305.1 magnesium chelatase [Nocardioides luteus]GLJ70283.1 magnesium chelatase [Nocardioides luteus]
MPVHYPFSAVLGCAADSATDLDDMGLALVLTTISPEIGGVLVRGEKGTAKSTAVRGLAAVLPSISVYAGDRFSIDPDDPSAESPDGPFGPGVAVESRPVRLVELPVGATEDRVVGSLHLESALSRGAIEFEPGLLARAHRGLLYVDEVNLLHDHLVDLLLDAAAMGRVSIERDGVSIEHASRFVLIGTMNPEEGELRPQLLDRFGLTVEVAAPRDPALRAEVVRRRMAFDLDAAAFAEGFASAERELTARIVAARGLVGKVRLTEPGLLKIAEVCAAFEVDGLRADIVTARTAVAHAAWAGRSEVTRADIRRAALLALPHRRRRNPFDAPGLDEELLDRILGDDELPPDPPEGPDDPEVEPVEAAPQETSTTDEVSTSSTSDDAPSVEPGERQRAGVETNTDASEDDQPGVSTSSTSGGDGSTTAAAPAYRPRLLTVTGVGTGRTGGRSKAIGTTGRRIGADTSTHGSLHLVETLKAAAGKQSARPRTSAQVELRPEDLRTAVREGREANLVLFCVDASGSMAARKRMAQVKAAVLSLLLDAYRRRDKVGMITFRGEDAELVLPPTGSVDLAAARLDEVPAGGRTPLAEGLLEAARVLQRERLRDPDLRPLLVVVTDGRANSKAHGKEAVRRSQQAAAYVAGLGVTTVVIDSESGPMRLGLARELAGHLGAEHVPVAEVSAEALTSAVQSRTQTWKGAA